MSWQTLMNMWRIVNMQQRIAVAAYKRIVKVSLEVPITLKKIILFFLYVYDWEQSTPGCILPNRVDDRYSFQGQDARVADKSRRPFGSDPIGTGKEPVLDCTCSDWMTGDKRDAQYLESVLILSATWASRGLLIVFVLCPCATEHDEFRYGIASVKLRRLRTAHENAQRHRQLSVTVGYP
jgi:hypothetical protein